MSATSFELLESVFGDPAQAPTGADDVFYRCLRCGSLTESRPRDSYTCRCGSIHIDVDYFRIVVRDLDSFEVLLRRDSKVGADPS